MEDEGLLLVNLQKKKSHVRFQSSLQTTDLGYQQLLYRKYNSVVDRPSGIEYMMGKCDRILIFCGGSPGTRKLSFVAWKREFRHEVSAPPLQYRC